MQTDLLRQVAERFGTPCYVYWMDQILERIVQIRQAFGGRFQISYAVKANPNRALLRRLTERVDHFDISSGGELIVAVEAGCDPRVFTFVGPAKNLWEMRLAARRDCVIVAESQREVAILDEIGAEESKVLSVILRVNPEMLPEGYGVSMSMRPTQFGIDEECVDAAMEQFTTLSHVSFAGFHIYAGTQCLISDSIAENISNCARIFRETSERHRQKPKLLIIGSGFGIPYHDRDERISMDRIAELCIPALDQLRRDPFTSGASLSLELGRYIVGEAGVYLSTVIRKKQTRGKEFLILDGGMNHNLAASGNLGSVIKRNYPLWCVTTGRAAGSKGNQELVGNMCTNIDSLGHNVDIGPVKENDVIAIGCSGAYGLTASPLHFISHRFPKEILVETQGAQTIMTDITQDGTVPTPPHWPND